MNDNQLADVTVKTLLDRADIQRKALKETQDRYERLLTELETRVWLGEIKGGDQVRYNRHKTLL